MHRHVTLPFLRVMTAMGVGGTICLLSNELSRTAECIGIRACGVMFPPYFAGFVDSRSRNNGSLE